MRYLFKPETSYEELLSSAKEAEAEWIENKSVRVKATVATLPDPGKKEREELKQQIEKLAAEMRQEGERQFGQLAVEKQKESNSSPVHQGDLQKGKVQQ